MKSDEYFFSSHRKFKDRTLSDNAYERVLSRIMAGEFPVGEKLPTELSLSQELGVSRPVLRQALKQLREDDVIVSRQGSGSFVKRRPDDAMLEFAPSGSIADIQRTFEFRAAIEGEAAYIAAERRTEDDLRRMAEALAELDRCAQVGELGVDADEEFHEAVCDAADNRYFSAARASMKSNILEGLNLTRSLSLTRPKRRLKLVQDEHYRIFDAIHNGERAAARTAMRHHIENARRRVFAGAESQEP